MILLTVFFLPSWPRSPPGTWRSAALDGRAGELLLIWAVFMGASVMVTTRRTSPSRS
jgi:hypothetical protein